MELSYLQILVCGEYPDYQTRHVKGGLRGFVREYFQGLDLVLSPLVHGRWRERLSAEHEAYATADVYASLMVFLQMNNLRLNMRPILPLSRRSEEYIEWKIGIPYQRDIELEPLRPKAKSLNVHTFLRFHEVIESYKEKDDLPPLGYGDGSLLLYCILDGQREAIADRLGAPLTYVASDRALQLVAVEQPLDWEECMELDNGTLKRYSRKLIDSWVETVHKHEDMLERDMLQLEADRREDAGLPSYEDEVSDEYGEEDDEDEDEEDEDESGDEDEDEEVDDGESESEDANDEVDVKVESESEAGIKAEHDSEVDIKAEEDSEVDIKAESDSEVDIKTEDDDEADIKVEDNEPHIKAEDSNVPRSTAFNAPPTHPARNPAASLPAITPSVPADSQLHTGISFSMAEANMKTENTGRDDSGLYGCPAAKEVQKKCIAFHAANAEEGGDEEDDRRLKREASPRKRKRSTSPDGRRRSPVKRV